MKQITSIFVLVFAFGLSVLGQTEQTPCPKLEIAGGGTVEPGQPMHFTVNATGLRDASNLKYQWTISNGTISGDPEAPAITVDTTGLRNTDITAKVKITGLPESCANTASETGKVFRGRHARLFDEFGKLSNNDAAARIQNLYVELGNDPEGHGYIILYGTSNEIAAREKQIKTIIERLKLDSSRITLVNGGANPRGKGIWTKIWI